MFGLLNAGKSLFGGLGLGKVGGGLLNAGSLIDACYKAWLGTEDSHMAELGDCVAGTLKAMQRPERKKEGRKYEETGVNAGDGKRRVAQLQETRDRRE